MTSPSITRSSSSVSLQDLSQPTSGKPPTGEPAAQALAARGMPAGMPEFKPARSERRNSDGALGSSAQSLSLGPRSKSLTRGMPPLGMGVTDTELQPALDAQINFTASTHSGEGLGHQVSSRRSSIQQSDDSEVESHGDTEEITPPSEHPSLQIENLGVERTDSAPSPIEILPTDQPQDTLPDAAQGDPHWLQNTVKAYALELGRQLFTCGLPTGGREVFFLGTCSALAPKLLDKTPHVVPIVIASQGVIAILDLVVQLKVRHPRLNRPNLDADAAARGYHGKDVAKWEAKPETRRQELRREQARGSHVVTGLGVIGNVTFIGVSIASYASGKDHGTLAVACLATQLRNLIYLSREPAQASTRAMALANDAQVPGVNRRNMRLMAGLYLVTNLAMGYAQAFAVRSALGQADQFILGGVITGGVITNQHGVAVTATALAKSIAMVAAIRGACNTVIEWIDSAGSSHLMARQAGTTLKPSVGFPMRDYGRLKDHSPARLDWNNFSTALPFLVQFLPIEDEKKLYAAVAIVATLFALSYFHVNKTYQAHAEVRRAAANLANAHTIPPEGEDRV